MKKVIVRIIGGLGNQLFCYAVARRLALANNAELVIDDKTGFARDCQYRRKYMLDRFQIPVRKATPRERMEPFERYHRGLAKFISRTQPFYNRHYVEQKGFDFDRRLLDFQVKGEVYLEGCWQSEKYFKDTEKVIRKDLQIYPPQDSVNKEMADRILSCNAVALHVRCFDKAAITNSRSSHNLEYSYYARAIKEIMTRTVKPHFFIFSDDPKKAHQILDLPRDVFTCVKGNQGDEFAYADLWLMTQCKHFIIANSTFSWWGAWLSNHKPKIVIAPSKKIGTITCWGFEGQIPDDWVVI
jgi:hypothetical protein